MSLNSQNTTQEEFNFNNVDIKRARPGLIYDAEGLTLIGKYSDEIAAHRARKEWHKILGAHFILENEKDYELKIYCSLDKNLFFISCNFVSACGRYAFWRLINRQAPEAEQKLNNLGERIQKPNKGFLLNQNNSKETTFVLSSIEEQINKNKENKSLIERLIHLFK